MNWEIVKEEVWHKVNVPDQQNHPARPLYVEMHQQVFGEFWDPLYDEVREACDDI